MPEGFDHSAAKVQRTYRRNPRHGFILLATLVSIAVLATLVGFVQTRAAANLRLAAALTSDLRDGFARDAIHDRMRGLIADQMIAETTRDDRPKLNSVPFFITQNGQTWRVEVQDVMGLVDIYFSAPAILEMALPDAGRFLSARQTALAPLAEGSRLPRLEMSLARFGLPLSEAKIFTQSTTSSQIRRSTSPDVLSRRLANLAQINIAAGQVQHVRISVHPG